MSDACLWLWHWFSCRLPLWFQIALFCLASSLIFLLHFNIDLLIAPIVKMLLFIKVSLSKTMVLLISSIKLATQKSLGAILAITASWEAWSLKKLLRQGIRTLSTLAARFVIFNFLISLFFGRERKGIRRLPKLIIFRVRQTWLGGAIDWWNGTSERNKRLLTGVILCVILVLIGQALIGFSILVFDLVWELIIIISRWLVRLWRWITPLLLRLVPNAISSFVTERVIPLFAEAVPLVRDDDRVIYARFNFRERYRKFKKNLLVFSRGKRLPLRQKIRRMFPTRIRKTKDRLLDSAVKLEDKEN